MITTGLIEHMVAMIGNTEEGIININYKAIMEVLIEIYFKVIARRSAIFIKNQIAGQLDTPLTSKRRHIISFIKMQEILEIIKLLQLISKASWFNTKA